MEADEKAGWAKTGRVLSNMITPESRLRGDHARVMHALVLAMDAAQNWADIMKCAETMVDVSICHFGPMLREVQKFSTDRLAMAGAAEVTAREESSGS